MPDKTTLYPKWVHDPSGFNKSVVVDDEEAEKKLLREWAAGAKAAGFVQDKPAEPAKDDKPKTKE